MPKNETMNFTVPIPQPPLFNLDSPNGQRPTVVWQAVTALTWEVPETDVPVPIYERTDAALYGAFAVPDGAKTLWEGCYSVQGNETIIHLFRTPISGPRTGPYDFPPPAAANPLKYDSDACTVTKNDTTGEGALLLECTVHEAISTTGRRSTLYRGVVTGLGITPYADGHAPLGAATNVFEAAPAPDPNPTLGPTPAQIAAAVLDALLAAMGGELGTLLQKKAKNGATEALAAHPAPALTGDQLAAAFWQEPFASRFRKLLKDAGFEMGSENHLWGLGHTTATADTGEHTNADESAGGLTP